MIKTPETGLIKRPLFAQMGLKERWAQFALQMSLTCSSRHYAGRSLEVFRALDVPVTSRMITDILARLVETVAEQGDDMQVRWVVSTQVLLPIGTPNICIAS